MWLIVLLKTLINSRNIISERVGIFAESIFFSKASFFGNKTRREVIVNMNKGEYLKEIFSCSLPEFEGETKFVIPKFWRGWVTRDIQSYIFYWEGSKWYLGSLCTGEGYFTPLQYEVWKLCNDNIILVKMLPSVTRCSIGIPVSRRGNSNQMWRRTIRSFLRPRVLVSSLHTRSGRAVSSVTWLNNVLWFRWFFSYNLTPAVRNCYNDRTNFCN